MLHIGHTYIYHIHFGTAWFWIECRECLCLCVMCKCAGFAGPHRLLVPSDGGQSFPHLNVFDVGWELLDGTPRF